MKPPPVKLTVAMTHPVQYYSPWFRHIQQHCPELRLKVIYAAAPSEEQQGAGFGTPFSWDVPLLEGYDAKVVRAAREGESFSSHHPDSLDVPELAAEVLQTAPDAVLVSGWQSATLIQVIQACRAAGIPLLYRGDTHTFTRPLSGVRLKAARFFWALNTRRRLRQFNGWLSVGQRARAYLLAHGVPPALIFASRHCVDNDFFAHAASPHQNAAARAEARRSWGLPENAFIALFAGKLDENKRPLDVIRALSMIRFPAALLVAGDGPLRGKCEAEARRLKVDVFFAGFQNQSQLGKFYGAADCLVLPSQTESWGLVVNEAMASGLPCVASDQAGCGPDLVIAGVTGELYPVGNARALAASLAKVHGADREKMAAACRERIRHYSFSQASTGLVAAAQSVQQLRHYTPSSRPQRVICACGHMVLVSGLERMTFEVLRLLRSQGAAVHCVVNSWENHRIVQLAENLGASWSIGLYYHPFERRNVDARKIWLMLYDTLMTSAGLLRDSIHFLPSHIFLPDFMTAPRNAFALLLLRTLGVRSILRLGNSPVRAPFFDLVIRVGVEPLVDLMIGNSRNTVRELLDIGVPAKKARAIYNTIPGDAPLRDPPPRVKHGSTIIYVGQIIPEKGVHVLLDAAGSLVPDFPDLQVLVVGRMDGWFSPAYGDYRERLRERAARSDLAGRVHFLGERSDVTKLFGQADVHCAPSTGPEGLPNVVLEAKLSACPTVAFDSFSFPELITHRVDGWLASHFRPEALAEGLRFFLGNAEKTKAAGGAARLSLKKFDRETFRREWLAVFDPVE